ncbi:MAG: TldD/PmbA family protein [Lentisphaeraceae bacterium]|nr:TldD/PmbA family protein [Lentisphaeraceae bacterium]
METSKAIEIMAAKAREVGSDQFDILAGESEDSSVKVYKGKVKETEISSSQGIGIRIFRDGKPGYSFTRKLSEDSIEQCVKDAADLSQFSAPVDFKLPSEKVVAASDLNLYNPALEKLEIAEMLELSFELEKKAEKSHESIENVLISAAGKSASKFYLLNSNDLTWQSQRNSTIAGVSLVAAKGDIKKSGGYFKSTRDFSEFDIDQIVGKATSKAVDLLDAKPIANGQYPVMFDHYMAPGMLASIMPALYAETVQKGQSKFEGKVGEQIAASCLTVYNDPFVPGLAGSGYIDSEGVPSQKFNVIENGVLKTYLYNLQSAAKAGVKPTGTGKRSYSGKAGTGFDNLFVKTGDKSRQEILNSLDKCLLVTKFEGSGIRSSISGEISIGCQGFLYEHGKVTQAVDRITISGNYFELLKNISEFSNEYSDSLSSTKIPDMLVSSMNISG